AKNKTPDTRAKRTDRCFVCPAKNKTPVISRSFQSSIKKRTVNQTVVCGKIPNIRFLEFIFYPK
ncbi:MAG: hypothetical protein KA933_10875, partial [Flavobacterium sp.]|nr:hypothetical protein [Flavobacterium sp.]